MDYEKPGVGDYYLVPRKTGREAGRDPYSYPVVGVDVLMTSVCVPVLRDGRGSGWPGSTPH